MKKIGIALLSVLTVSTALGGLATFNASAAVEDIPEAVEVSNVASGKEVTFRDLLDVSTTLTMYNYYPNGGGLAGTGCYAMDGAEVAHRGGNHITDGESNDWTGYKTNSTYANLAGWAYLDMGAEYAVEKVKVHMLASWSFKDVIVQVSNDPTFKEGVTTVFSSCDSLTLGEDVVYDGGLVGVTENTDLTGYTSGAVKSNQVAGNIFMANGAMGRYVRVTNNNRGNGGADSNTNISELEVYVANSGIFAPSASVSSGTYESLTTVELTASQENAEIYYTLDGSYPTKNSTKYEGAIDASSWTGAVALRAITVVDGKQSEAADYIYKITVPSENKALGKAVSFRSLTDMNTVLAAYAYYPDGNGDAFSGTGVYNLSRGDMGRLTDGNASWKSFQAHSTAPGVRGWAFLDLGEEITIDNIQVGFLSGWDFDDVVIQVSNDPTFATGVTTVFASCASLSSGEVVVYNGGQVNCSVDTKAETGWNGNVSVNSANGALRTYDANGISARYVRLTDNTNDCGGATAETVFCEIQVWSKAGAVIADPEIKDTVKSVTAVENEISVTPGTTLEGVKAELPATVSYTTMAGATGEIALSWESANWAEMTQGTFTFIATPVLSVDDAFDIIPASYSISVTVKKADTTALDALIAEVEALNGATYTQKTWNPLAALITEAKTASAEITVTKEAVEKYVTDITAAKVALQELATDKTALAQAVATAGTIDKANYMSATVEGLDEALATATTVNNDADASVTEATAALNALNEVLNGLVEKGDTTALAALVNEIKGAGYVEDNYTAMSYATLVDALAAAEAIVAATETPKTDVEAAYTALENAKNGLVAYGNNAELSALVTECGALAQADYTVNSWTALAAKLTAASALLEGKQMQDVLDAAKAELQSAKDGLVSVVALKAAIASTIDETAYTAITVQAWKDAKAEAQLVLDNPAATADEVASAVAAIEAAEEALVEKPVDDGNSSSDTTVPGGNSGSSDNTEEEPSAGGCGSVVGAVSAAVALAGAAAVVLLKKKEN